MDSDAIRLMDVLEARKRVAPYLRPTLAFRSGALSKRFAGEIWLKPENLQVTGSFKIRGAVNRIADLRREGVSQIITASAGNHGQGVAMAAGAAGIAATVVVPENVSPAKLEALRRLPCEVVLRGRNFDEADVAMLELAKERGSAVVSPYDAAVVAGQGTAGLDFLLEVPDIDLLLIPVGAGGLIAGCAVAAKSLNPQIEVVGVQAAVSPSMVAALEAGRIVPIECGDSLADGLAGNIIGGELPFGLIQRYVDRVVLVDEAAIAEAMRLIVAEERLIVEGAGAAGIAALLAGVVDARGRRAGVILSGGNVAYDTLLDVLRG